MLFVCFHHSDTTFFVVAPPIKVFFLMQEKWLQIFLTAQISAGGFSAVAVARCLSPPDNS